MHSHENLVAALSDEERDIVVTALLTKEELMAVSHRPEGLIKKCRFATAPEHPDCQLLKSEKGGSHLVFNYYTGSLCYTFNFDPDVPINGPDRPIVTSAILGEGLDLLLDIEGAGFQSIL